jgi:tetratricopeptide (TPR) repeat protein
LNRHLLYLIAPAIVLASPCVRAQLIDDADIKRLGADAVITLRFVAPLQYRRSLPARSGDAVQAYYDVVAGQTLPSLGPYERRLPPTGQLPEIRIIDDARTTHELSRRVVVQLSRPVPMRVRAGSGNRTLEIVLKGLGPAVQDKAAEAPPLPAGPGFRIVLLQSAQPELQLDPSIPASLGAFAVSTGSRVIEGRTVYEVALGDFATRTEAQAALQTLLARFPQAVIVANETPSTATAQEPPGQEPPAPQAASTLPAPNIDQQAAQLLAQAQAAAQRQDLEAALAALGELLNLPPNPSTREAQALAGDLRLKAGDVPRARAEYETFLRLYPQGPDADRVRQALAGLPQPEPAERPRPRKEPTSTLTGSFSAFYYGGASKIRTQEFQESPISGLPELASDQTLSGEDQRQVMTSADVNWRYRDQDTDMRFVFRDNHIKDLLRSDKSRNRLSALYFEHRSLVNGTHIKLGRQSPTGGGVLGRFDGVQAGYTFAPKWRINGVVGRPTDTLLDSRRHFYGAWIDVDGLLPSLGVSLYANQQMIDGEIDRRAIGSEMRYFRSGVSLTGQLDYDPLVHGLNTAAMQGTWQLQETTVVNFLYDRRATPVLTLGNALFFGTLIDPMGVQTPRRLQDLLDAGFTVPQLRETVKSTTPYTTQALIGATTAVSKNWQIGGDLRLTRLGELPPIPDVLPTGQGRSDNKAAGLQLIGTNLYSARDTHVISLSVLKGSTESLDTSLARSVREYDGQLLSYNNSSQINEFLLVEPSLKLYLETDNAGLKTRRVGPGLRVTYRVGPHVAVESEVSGEASKVTGPSRNETAHRVYYYLGSRYEF